MINRYRIRGFSVLLLLSFSALIACTSEVAAPADSEHAEDHVEDDHTEETVLTLDQETIDAAGIEVADSTVMEVPEFLETTGVVSANESRLVHVRPISEGIVREVHVQKGDRVEEGQVLLAYDSIQMGELVGELHSLQAQLRRALAQEEVALKLLERGKELYRSEAISEKDLDLRTIEHQSAVEAANSYRAEIARTLEKLRRLGATHEQIQSDPGQEIPVSVTVLKAPFSGTVIDYDVASGEVISPDRVVLTIADLSRLWIHADVYERDLAAVQAGREVEVTTNSYPDRSFPARVTYIGDEVAPRTRTVKVRSVAENPVRLLKLGMFVTVRIRTGSVRALTVVPTSALQMIDGRVAVFVRLDGNRFEPRTVKTGPSWQGWTAVEEGLEPGQPIVTVGAFSLKSELLREALGGGHAH